MEAAASDPAQLSAQDSADTERVWYLGGRESAGQKYQVCVTAVADPGQTLALAAECCHQVLMFLCWLVARDTRHESTQKSVVVVQA